MEDSQHSFLSPGPARRSPALAPRAPIVAGLLALGLLSACQEPAGAQAQAAPVEVGVVTVETEPVAIDRELPGRTSPHRIAEVRARVDGIVLERLFEEGSDVEEGQVLYRIDPGPYQAALESAKATLARAEASVASNRLLAQRYGELLESRAVSQQEHDNAMAAWKAAEADVAAGRAAVKAAQINLSYTRVTSPIAGRIGRAEVTEGGFVRQAEGTRMAVVQQLDPIYVDVTQTTTEMLRLQRLFEAGELQRSGEGAQVGLVLEDGSRYEHTGTLQFSDVTVNPGTGSITLRAIFPNPDSMLLPGMFVRAELEQGVQPEAVLLPQIAVRRDAQGKASVLVVTAENTVEVRPVEAPRVVGNRWMITEGLQPGDKVIVEGLQKVRPGQAVSAVPAGAQAARHAAAL